MLRFGNNLYTDMYLKAEISIVSSVLSAPRHLTWKKSILLEIREIAIGNYRSIWKVILTLSRPLSTDMDYILNEILWSI